MCQSWSSTKIMREIVLFSGENLHSWQKFYTTAGRDGRDKSQLWVAPDWFIVNKRREEKLSVDLSTVDEREKLMLTCNILPTRWPFWSTKGSDLEPSPPSRQRFEEQSTTYEMVNGIRRYSTPPLLRTSSMWPAFGLSWWANNDLRHQNFSASIFNN